MGFPTAEGFYDFVRNKYIYQYKDHLGNTRLSFMKNSAGVLQALDKNDYYPFGMNHLDPNTASFFGNSSYKNYKFLGEELQETGFYDLNARFYMPDAVIFGQHDPLSEKTMQPYAYSYNNPIRYKDPTGLSGTDWVHNRSTNSVYWNDKATSQATAGANETYLGKSGTYTAQDGSTTLLNPNGKPTNNSLLGGSGIAPNLDPLIRAGDAGPLMSALAFGHNDDSYIRETPASNSPEVSMGNPSGQLAVAGLYGLQGGTMEIASSKALGALAKVATTSDGFLFGSVGFKTPVNINVSLYASENTMKYGTFKWSTIAPDALGNTQAFGRNMLQITHEFQPTLGTWTSQVIPKGTYVRAGLVGPQVGGGAGTWLQLYTPKGVNFVK